MDNKKGFTLVELLAVIAILAILVMIALPNIMGMFNSAKINSFSTEVKAIYKAAKNKKMFQNKNIVFETGDLDVNGGDDLVYSISLNKKGEIICFEVKNDYLIWSFRGNSENTLKDISKIAPDIQIKEVEDDEYIVNCNYSDKYDIAVAGNLGKQNSWYKGDTEKDKIERIIITNNYKSTNYNERFFADEENVGGIEGFVEDNVVYIVNNRNKRKSNALLVSPDASNTFAGFPNLKYISGLKIMDFKNVENMSNFFGGLDSEGQLVNNYRLNYINGYENINTQNVTNMSYAFANLKLSMLNLGSWNVGKVTTANGMFKANKASSINLSGWNVSNLNDYTDMFNGSEAKSITLGDWKTNANATYRNMFSNAKNLVTIVTKDNFKVNNRNTIMFDNTKNILGANGTTYKGNTAFYARLDKSGSAGYFTDIIPNGILVAKLYDSGSNSSSSIDLTDAGISPSPWNLYTGPRLLEIKVFSMQPGTEKTIDITVPAGMYIVKDSWTKSGNGIKSVSFTKSTSQGTGTYTNNQTGTLKYTINSTASNTIIQCLVMFDTAIWNKKKATSTTDYMIKGDAITVNYNKGASIKKASNITSATGLGERDYGYTFYTHNYNSSVYLNTDATLLRSASFLSSDQSTVPYYYKEFKFEMTASSTDSSGKTIYADVKNVTNVADPTTYIGGLTNMGKPVSYSYNSLNGTHTIIWNNPYTLSGITIPRFTYNLDSSKGFTVGKKLAVKMTYTVKTLSGQTFTDTKTVYYTIKGTAINASDLEIGGSGKNVPVESYYKDTEYIDVMGYSTLRNIGYDDFINVAMTYEYDVETAINTKPKMKVYAARVAAEKNQKPKLSVTLIDDNGKSYGPYENELSCSSSTDGIYVSAANIARLNALTSGKYYLKKITYTLPKISGTRNITNNEINYLYHSQGAGSQGSGGTVIGRVSSAAKTKVTVVPSNGTKKETTFTSTPVSSFSFSGYISSIGTPNGTEINAGNEFGLDINVGSVSYPYTNTQAFSKPEIYLILPFGVSIEEVKLLQNSSATNNLADAIITKVKSLTINDTLNYVYRIDFNKETWFGYLNDKLTSAGAGQYSSLCVKVKLNTDETMEYTSINLRDSVYFKDKNGHISISGSYDKYRITDKYDIDNDGSKSDYFGTIVNTDKIINIYGSE